jgi:hypothetical protein
MDPGALCEWKFWQESVANETDLDSPELVARQARDYRTALQTNHKSDKTVTKGMDPATLFADAGACILMPGVTEGPLCMWSGKLSFD